MSRSALGCTLPVEMFFPEAELPTPGLRAALARLGVTARALPRAVSRMPGFTMKAATVLLSGFEEVGGCLMALSQLQAERFLHRWRVLLQALGLRCCMLLLKWWQLRKDTKSCRTRRVVPLGARPAPFHGKVSFAQILFLDSDNIAVRNPTPLFDSPAYQKTGALLWPDYWEGSAAPDIADVLNIEPSALPPGSFESGQMVLHRRRCCPAPALGTSDSDFEPESFDRSTAARSLAAERTHIGTSSMRPDAGHYLHC